MAELVVSVGGSTGREIDKFQKFNIALDKPVKTAVPILKMPMLPMSASWWTVGPMVTTSG